MTSPRIRDALDDGQKPAPVTRLVRKSLEVEEQESKYCWNYASCRRGLPTGLAGKGGVFTIRVIGPHR
jgi:hypothetical protein